MIDFHSHLLPELDDGSRSCKQSVCLLKEEEKCEVKKVVLTPHFYAYQNNIETFLEKREESLKKLCTALENDPVNIELYLGAETYFFEEIWRVDDIEKLCIEGTNYLLLELPVHDPCSKTVFRAIHALLTQRNIVPIMAHFERYIYKNANLRFLKELVDNGCILQMNAGYINNFWTRGKAVSFFKKGTASLLGTDMHNEFNIKKDYKKAYTHLAKKLSEDRISEFLQTEEMIIKNAKPCYIPK